MVLFSFSDVSSENTMYRIRIITYYSSLLLPTLHFPAFAFLSGIWAYFIIPETRGRTLEQIDGVSYTSSSETYF